MRYLLCVGTFLFASFTSISLAFTPQQGFKLLNAVASSELIVQGRFEKNLSFTTTHVFFGSLPEDGILKLEVAEWILPKLIETLRVRNSPELILFLHRRTNGDLYVETTCLIAFDEKEETWASLDDTGSLAGNSFQRYNTRYKRQFLELLQRIITDVNHFLQITSKPRSTERIAELLKFLNTHLQDIDRPSDFELRSHWNIGSKGYASYYFDQASHYLMNPSKSEADLLMECIDLSSNDTQRAAFINILRNIESMPFLFERVKPQLRAGNGMLTRREAFAAVVNLDSSKGFESLIPFLNPTEPQLTDVFRALSIVGSLESSDRHIVWPKKVIDPLLLIAKQMHWLRDTPNEIEMASYVGMMVMEKMQWGAFVDLKPVMIELISKELGDRRQALCSALKEFNHPRLIAELWYWSVMEANQPLGFKNWDRSASERNATSWLEKYGGFLNRTYDLQANPALDWFGAYAAGDEYTKRMLLRLWEYEDHINEEALLKQVSMGPFAEEAKHVVVYLKEKKRLTHHL